MSKSSVSEYVPEGAKAGRLFTKRDIHGIITNAGGLRDSTKRNEFASQLEEIAHWFLLNRLARQRPAPSKTEKQLHAIQGGADSLLKALDGAALYPLRRAAERHGKSIGGYPDSPPRRWEMEGQTYMDYRGNEKLGSVVSGIRLLKAWAQDEKGREREKVDRNKSAKRHAGDEAMQEFIEGLAGLGLAFFEIVPGASVGTPASKRKGEVGGPFIRFVSDCLNAMKENLAPEAFVDDPGLKKALSPSGSAIRERVRKLTNQIL